MNRRRDFLLVGMFVVLLIMTGMTAKGVVKKNTVRIKSTQTIVCSVEHHQRLELPKTVNAVMSDGAIRKVSVAWGSKFIDTSKTGNKTYYGKVIGYSRNAVLKVKVQPTVEHIEEIREIAYVMENWEFPEQIPAIMSNGTIAMFAVDWHDSVADTSEVGAHTFSGTVRGSGEKVTLILSVCYSVEEVEQIKLQVRQNEEFIVPETVELTLIDGSKVDAMVIWDNKELDTSKTGTTIFEGSVAGWNDGKAQLEVKVVHWIEKIEDLTLRAKHNEQVKLPVSVLALFSDKVLRNVAVDWNTDKVDTEIDGTYDYLGEVQDYDGLVKLTLTILPEIAYVEEVVVNIKKNTVVELPKMVDVVMTNKERKQQPVAWENKTMDMSRESEYLVKGTVQGCPLPALARIRIDETAPVVKSFEIVTKSIEESGRLVCKARVSDENSGVAKVTAYFESTDHGYKTSKEFVLSESDNLWVIDQSLELESWICKMELSRIKVEDGSGNWREIGWYELGGSMPPFYLVTLRQQKVAPVLESITVEKAAFQLWEVIPIEVVMESDNVYEMNVHLVSPSGNRIDVVSMSHKEGKLWQGKHLVSSYDEQGIWEIRELETLDKDRQLERYGMARMPGKQTPKYEIINPDGDGKPPVLDKLELLKDKFSSSEKISLRARVLEERSGVRYVFAYFLMPNQEMKDEFGSTVSVALYLNRETGMYEGGNLLYLYPIAGLYKLKDITLIDEAGNRKVYQRSEIPGGGNLDFELIIGK